MHTEPTDHIPHHKNRHVAEKFENLLGVLMVVAIAILAVGLVWGIMGTGDAPPSWMK